ncbi:MAG TPA: histidine kinase N-terminal 7TM domain-containing protein [Bacillota bacterium]|nr:histidine kinase N-terminal 7TM domain-containing protein [Bacillota bacterium]
MQITIETTILLVSINLSLFIIVYCLMFGKRSPLFYSFITIHGLTLIWILADLVKVTAPGVSTKLATMGFENIASCLLGFVWLRFASQYTFRRWSRKVALWVVLLLISVTLTSGFLTNRFHGLAYTVFATNLYIHSVVYGPLLWLSIGVNYLYISTGTWLIYRYSRQIRGDERRQAVILIFAAVTPLFFDLMSYVQFIHLPYNITPLSLSISLLLFTIATFKYRFLDTVPLALYQVFETIEVATLLLNNEASVIAANLAFETTFTGHATNSIVDFVAFLSQSAAWSHDNEVLFTTIRNGTDTPIFGELVLEDPIKQVFRVAIHPVYDRRRRNIGRVVTFTDITSLRRLARELEQKNEQLAEMNRQLVDHLQVVEELAIVKERNRLARDIHDTLGHTLTLLTKIQEAAIGDFESDPQKTLAAVKKTREITRDGLKELRVSINNMMSEKGHSETLDEALNRLVDTFTNSKVTVVLNVDGKPSALPSLSIQTIYKICQEALTNSIKHGNASEIHIMLRFQEAGCSLFIIDNGSGCLKIHKGHGLSGMEERIRKVHGTIVFGSDGEHGFNIHVEIPFRGVNSCLS